MRSVSAGPVSSPLWKRWGWIGGIEMSYLELAVSLRNYVVIYSATQVPNLTALFWDNLWQAADAIEQLQKSICPHYIRNVHDRGDDSLCDKYKCEVNALTKWIPVTERLPKDGEFVLVCNDDGHMMIAKHETETYEWYYKYTNYDFDIWDNGDQGPVCYWMPLPTPPKEDEA